jgi:hypothetical protein
VDSIAGLVGHPNLTAVGPEACRHYSWSFNQMHRIGRKQGRDGRGISMYYSSNVVNAIDAARLARYDHVVAKYASMVERNPVVVR